MLTICLNVIKQPCSEWNRMSKIILIQHINLRPPYSLLTQGGMLSHLHDKISLGMGKQERTFE